MRFAFELWHFFLSVSSYDIADQPAAGNVSTSTYAQLQWSVVGVYI